MRRPIMHIAERAEWEAAQDAGEYRISTRDLSLDEVGFIHCSRPDQVETVANAFYVGAPDLVLLVIDPERVTVEIREEVPEGEDDAFPHLYGPLNLDAVVEVHPLAADVDGRFRLPQGLG